MSRQTIGAYLRLCLISLLEPEIRSQRDIQEQVFSRNNIQEQVFS